MQTPDHWQQVEEIFHAALERPPAERAAYLAEVCASEAEAPELLEDVQAMLAAHEQAGDFMEQPLDDDASGWQAAGSPLSQSSFSHYRMLSLLGKGGMGEVWLSEDTQLGRKVAVKLLLAEFTTDADRVRRFTQEARAASALNHPNIITIHEIGEASAEEGGMRYIAMEYVEGETLRQRIMGAPQHRIEPPEAIDLALQIAAALSAAHEAGITHRDIKPENVMVRPDGYIKVLDFGLAKLIGPSAPALSFLKDSQTPMAPAASTASGVMMGTPRYMSPEQARGEKVDMRSDIFSLGVILYEMLSGRRPFSGESAVEIMNAILKEDPPDLVELNTKVSPQLEKIVRRCLEKRPERRFYSAHDLGFALEVLSAPSSSSGAERRSAAPALDATLPAKRIGWRERLPWVVTGALGLALLALGAAYFNRSTADTRPVRLAFALPENLVFDNQISDKASVSPDGRKLAFTGRSADGTQKLWVRPLDSSEAQPLPGTDNARGAFWAPDSRSLAFGSQGKLKRVDLAGGRPQTLCDAAQLQSGAWSHTGVILFAPSSQSELFQIPDVGGKAVPVTSLDLTRRETAHQDPCFLPDGRRFLYRSGGELGQGVFAGSLDGKKVKQVVAEDTPAVYAPPGWLLFVRDGALMAQSFDAGRLELKGEAVPLTRPANTASIAGIPFSVSENGVLIWQGDRRRDYQLVWFDRAGKQVAAAGPPIKTLVGQGPRFSPDGKRVIFQRVDPESRETDIWVIDLASNLSTRLTADPGFKSRPIWSPDGSRVAYGTRVDTYQKNASGVGAAEVLVKREVGATNYAPTDWSPDGRFMLYSRTARQTQRDIWALPMTGARRPYPLLNTEFDEYRAQLSPDGRWLAYVSDESGSYEVYAQPFTSDGKLGETKVRISAGGGNQPRWRRDGRELFYVAADGQMIAVTLKMGGAMIEPGTPKALFKTRMMSELIQSSIDYDVTADGQRFLIGTLVGEPTPISVILNWTAEVKR